MLRRPSSTCSNSPLQTSGINRAVDDVTVRVASIGDLISMKKTAGRPRTMTTSRSSRLWISSVDKPLKEYSWPDSRDELAEVVARTTPSQRLEWLEEILDLAFASGGLQKARQLESIETRSKD